MLSSSSLSIHASFASGNMARWMLSSAVLSTVRTMFCQICSVMKGIMGAEALHTVTRAVQSVM